MNGYSACRSLVLGRPGSGRSQPAAVKFKFKLVSADSRARAGGPCLPSQSVTRTVRPSRRPGATASDSAPVPPGSVTAAPAFQVNKKPESARLSGSGPSGYPSSPRPRASAGAPFCGAAARRANAGRLERKDTSHHQGHPSPGPQTHPGPGACNASGVGRATGGGGGSVAVMRGPRRLGAGRGSTFDSDSG